MPVVVIPTGVANTASVLAGLRRAGAEPVLADGDHGRISRLVAAAPRVVLPGVGAFAAGMESLDNIGVVTALRDRIAAGLPTLAVCLGFQLLCAASEESPGTAGLGVLTAVARRFTGDVRVPQIGWNRIRPAAGCRLLRPAHLYFANSYRVTDAPRGWSAATADHGGTFVAAVERGPVLACQFHPELSGTAGTSLLRRWLEASC